MKKKLVNEMAKSTGCWLDRPLINDRLDRQCATEQEHAHALTSATSARAP